MQSQVPALIADYFGVEAVREQHPTISHVFVNGRWVNYPGAKKVSLTHLRKERRRGVTGVQVTCAGRYADFTVDEIIRHSERLARQPLFGGKVI